MTLPGSQLFFHLICLCMLPTHPTASVPSNVQGEEEGPQLPCCYCYPGLVPTVALSSVVLLRQSSSWMLLKAPLQGEVGLGHRKVGGKSCLDGPTSLFRKRGSLPPIILGFGASTEARKCPVYNSATHSLSLSLFFFWYFLIPFTHFFYPHPHLWQSILCIYELVLLFLFFSESIYKCKTIQYWFFSL